MEPTTFVALKVMEERGYISRRQMGGNRRKVHIFRPRRGARSGRSLFRWPKRSMASRSEAFRQRMSQPRGGLCWRCSRTSHATKCSQ